MFPISKIICPTCGTRLIRRVPVARQGPSKPLSERQQGILSFIRQYLEEHQRPPSQREIVKARQFSGLGHLNYHLAILEEQGYLQRDYHKARGLMLLEPGILAAENDGRPEAPAV